MTEDPSPEEQTNSGDTGEQDPDPLAELEETYQEHRVLRTETAVTARISNVGVGDRVYVELAVSEANRWVIRLEKSLRGVKTLFDIHEVVDVQFGTDLGDLVGETVPVRFPNDDMSLVSIGSTEQVTEPIAPAGQCTVPGAQSIPEEVATCARRLERYHSTDTPVIPVRITAAEPRDGVLTMRLRLLGEHARLDVPVPEQGQIAGSRFETIVETVGHGSVRQVQDGRLYTVRERTLPRPAEQIPMAVGAVRNWVVTWVLFPAKSQADEALTLPASQSPPGRVPSDEPAPRSRPVPSDELAPPGGPAPPPNRPGPNPHSVPRSEVEPFARMLQPDEVVEHVGTGGPIEIERGRTTESVASMSGFEWPAVTDRRLLLKSSQVTGDEFFEFDYDEIQTVEFSSGVIDKTVSVHTADGVYRITVSEPDEQTCKKMVGFVESKIYADR